jgi:8-oxo-dGTP diphosphatase
MLKCACVALIDHENRIFVDKRSQHGSMPGVWECPGGKCEAGESPIEAAIREVKEEIDITLFKNKLDYISCYRPSHGGFALHFFATRYWEGDIKLLANQEDMLWCSIEDLKKLPLPDGNIYLLKKLKKYMIKMQS